MPAERPRINKAGNPRPQIQRNNIRNEGKRNKSSELNDKKDKVAKNDNFKKQPSDICANERITFCLSY